MGRLLCAPLPRDRNSVTKVFAAVVDRVVLRADPHLHGGRPTRVDDRPWTRRSVLRLWDRRKAQGRGVPRCLRRRRRDAERLMTLVETAADVSPVVSLARVPA